MQARDVPRLAMLVRMERTAEEIVEPDAACLPLLSTSGEIRAWRSLLFLMPTIF